MRTRSGRVDGRRDAGVKARRPYWGSEALTVQVRGIGPPSVLSLHLLHFLLAFNPFHLLHLLYARANASHHARMPRTGTMYDTRADINEWDIFVHESFDPTFIVPPWSLADVLRPRVPVILAIVLLERGMTETKIGCTTAWVTSADVGGGERGRTGMDASLESGRVLDVV